MLPIYAGNYLKIFNAIVRDGQMNSFFDALSKAIVKQRRKFLSRTIYERYDGVVQYGPYKNMKLGNKSNISSGPLALKVLGLYEHLVVEKINSVGKFDDFINFGAADGYMALGPLFNKSCQRAICFELTKTGRDSVRQNAELNNLNSGLEIMGRVDSSIVNNLKEYKLNPKKTVILCDIEGAEFTIFTAELLTFLTGATIIIELHDKLMKNQNSFRNDLLERVPKNASTYIISNKNRLDFEGLYDLEILSDNDRAIVMSEGRKFYGEWLVIEYL